jgi:pimeloyl-ACP methyl ester carboxylesterase
MSYRLGIALLLSSFALSACRSLPGIPHKIEAVPPQHIIYIDTHGRLVDPTGDIKCYQGDDWQEQFGKELTKHGFSYVPHLSSKPCRGTVLGLNNLDLRNSKDYLDDIFSAMHGYHNKKFINDPERLYKRRVAIIVHGGLNSNSGNIEAARDITLKMLNDPNAPYPIFINWQSNLWGSLWDHIVKVRQGDSKGYRHSFLAPFYLAADLAKGIGRAPATWFYHYSNDLDRIKKRRNRRRNPERQTQEDKIYCDLRREYTECLAEKGSPCDVFRISKGPFWHTTAEGARSTTRNGLTNVIPVRYYSTAFGGPTGKAYTWLPLKLLVAPLLDGLGTSAWDTMIRHVQVGFHNDGVEDLQDKDRIMEEPRPRTDAFPEGDGGVARFMRRLREEIENTSRNCGADPDHPCLQWELTLIGHSMGSIMANHILFEFGDGPEFKNIVYMAAAASVNDYEHTALEYLKKHTETQMYHLTLHDFAEIRDQYAWEVPPSGSLLVWIDNFLSKPATLRDRTVGRYVNLMLALPATPRNLRSRIHVKTFGVGEVLEWSDPQHHGDFNDFLGQPSPTGLRAKFWDSEFWKPDVKDRPSAREQCPNESP